MGEQGHALHWRVVLGRLETSPNSLSRVRVRSSEVLPVLVCPTTAMRMGGECGLFILASQPSQGNGLVLLNRLDGEAQLLQ